MISGSPLERRRDGAQRGRGGTSLDCGSLGVWQSSVEVQAQQGRSHRQSSVVVEAVEREPTVIRPWWCGSPPWIDEQWRRG
jgi:hypothetical protein